MLRGIIAFVVLVFLGWFAWWFIGSSAQRTALEGWMADRRDRGWVAETADLSVQGFPNRFDSVLTDLRLADPRSGWAWSAPEFRILMLSYQPNKAILVWPGAQTVAAPGETATVTSEKMRASVSLTPDLDLALDQAIVEIDGMDVRGQAGWAAALSRAVLGLRRSARAEGDAYDLSVDARNATLPGPLRDTLDPAGVLPRVVEALTIDTTLALDAPIDLAALEGRKPAMTAITVRQAEFGWGDVRLTLTGRGEVDAGGVLSGEFDLTATNWRKLIAMAVEGGALPRDMAGTVEGGLSLLAMLSPGQDTIAAPLSFRDGRAWLGPAPVGDAPRLPAPRK